MQSVCVWGWLCGAGCVHNPTCVFIRFKECVCERVRVRRMCVSGPAMEVLRLPFRSCHKAETIKLRMICLWFECPCFILLNGRIIPFTYSPPVFFFSVAS